MVATPFGVAGEVSVAAITEAETASLNSFETTNSAEASLPSPKMLANGKTAVMSIKTAAVIEILFFTDNLSIPFQ